MNKWMKFGVLAIMALAVGFAGVTVVAAQENEPPVGPPPGPWGPQHGEGHGPGMGLMADYSDIIHEAIADVLGISVSDFEAAIEAGQTPFTLAEEYDVELEDLRQAMDEARDEALAQAVEDGAISEEQAERMQQAPRGRGPMQAGCDGDGPVREGTGHMGPRGGRWGGNS